ncbi:Senecionine N-oxygenase [Bonamia ostreae]|uniref:glutaminase n=1 Tax=Bonamia ostreae TaxID=126728 RepID=A0ABV2AM27_9EUKA
MALQPKFGDFSKLTVGIIAIHGDFTENKICVEKLGAKTKLIRSSYDFDESINAIIIPGGESSTISLLLNKDRILLNKLVNWTKNGYPTYGICGGMILLSEFTRSTEEKKEKAGLLRALRMTVDRNFFEKNGFCFKKELEIPIFEDPKFCGIFIRGPAITKPVDKEIEVLCSIEIEKQKVILAVRKGAVLATSFHPELTDDLRFHKMFLETALDFNKK